MERKLEEHINLRQLLNLDHTFMTEIYSETSGRETVERFHEHTRKLRELKQRGPKKIKSIQNYDQKIYTIEPG
jgi:hypothetical protein